MKPGLEPVPCDILLNLKVRSGRCFLGQVLDFFLLLACARRRVIQFWLLPWPLFVWFIQYKMNEICNQFDEKLHRLSVLGIIFLHGCCYAILWCPPALLWKRKFAFVENYFRKVLSFERYVMVQFLGCTTFWSIEHPCFYSFLISLHEKAHSFSIKLGFFSPFFSSFPPPNNILCCVFFSLLELKYLNNWLFNGQATPTSPTNCL